MKNNTLQARSSGGEHYLDTVGVPGSNPGVPTIDFKGLRFHGRSPFFLFCHQFAFIPINNRGFQLADVLLPGGFQEMGVKGEGGVGLAKLGLGILSL